MQNKNDEARAAIALSISLAARTHPSSSPSTQKKMDAVRSPIRKATTHGTHVLSALLALLWGS
jgi:hypothetical protein